MLSVTPDCRVDFTQTGEAFSNLHAVNVTDGLLFVRAACRNIGHVPASFTATVMAREP